MTGTGILVGLGRFVASVLINAGNMQIGAARLPGIGVKWVVLADAQYVEIVGRPQVTPDL